MTTSHDAGREARAFLDRTVPATDRLLHRDRAWIAGPAVERAMLAFAAALTRPPAQAGAASVEVDSRGEAMICTGCGTSRTVAAIKASSATAFTCCPERKMIPAREMWDAWCATKDAALSTPAASGEIPGGMMVEGPDAPLYRKLAEITDEQRADIRRIMTGEADEDRIRRGDVHEAIRSLRTNPVPSREYQRALGDMGKLVTALSTLKASAETGIPQGWKLVPIEPTSDMMFASRRYPVYDYDVRRVWSAMISAAPSAPATEAGEEA